MQTPNFDLMWKNFPDHVAYPTLDDLHRYIGGQLKDNIDVPGFGATGNTCAVRMSRALNYGSAPIQKGIARGLGLSVLTGADKMHYLFRVRELKKYLAHVLGAPLVVKKAPFGDALVGLRGIVAMNVSGWSNASGHVALWSDRQFREPTHDNYLNLTDDPNTKVVEGTTQISVWKM